MVPRGRLALLEAALQSADRLSKSPWITEEGFRDAEDLLDMGRIGRSLMDDIASCVHSTAGYEHWSPADDPAEIVVDLINDLTDTRAALQSAEQERDKLAEEVERLKPLAAGVEDVLAGRCGMWHDLEHKRYHVISAVYNDERLRREREWVRRAEAAEAKLASLEEQMAGERLLHASTEQQLQDRLERRSGDVVDIDAEDRRAMSMEALQESAQPDPDVARLVEACKPFAAMPGKPIWFVSEVSVKVSTDTNDFKRAAEALAPFSSTEEKG
jgi:hypothetical protein